jgi:hypothetical protein
VTTPTYRVGRHLGRTIYRHNQLIGVMDTPEDGRLVVDALNAAERIPATIAALAADCGCPCRTEPIQITRHTDVCSARQAARRLADTIDDERYAVGAEPEDVTT